MEAAIEATRAEQAYAVESKVKEGLAAARTVWVALAAYLAEFHEGKMWEALGHENFVAWCASPDIDLGQSQAYALIDAYRYFVADKHLGSRGANEVKRQELLARYEPSKLAQVLPALKRGEVDQDDALSDVESLSRSDLRTKYAKSREKAGAPRGLVRCDQCGGMKAGELKDDG